MDIKINNPDNLPEEEIKNYIAFGKKKYAGKTITAMTVTLAEDDNVDLKFEFASVPFDRIRRITGYLVGTLDRFNNGKRAEVGDRVPHTAPAVERNENNA
jgi:hypothetical protein